MLFHACKVKPLCVTIIVNNDLKAFRAVKKREFAFASLPLKADAALRARALASLRSPLRLRRPNAATRNPSCTIYAAAGGRWGSASRLFPAHMLTRIIIIYVVILLYGRINFAIRKTTLFPLVEEAIPHTPKILPHISKITFEMRKNTFEVIQNISNIILAFWGC